MVSYRGIVRDNVVVLPEGVHLADGLEVQIRTPAFTSEADDVEMREDLFKQRLRDAGLLVDTAPREPLWPVQYDELSPEELQELLDERLRAAGLITGPTRRSDEAPPIVDRKPIVVRGKPLSQMIIDDRR